MAMVMRILYLIPLLLIGALLLGGCVQSAPSGGDTTAPVVTAPASNSSVNASGSASNASAPIVSASPSAADACAALSGVLAHDTCFASLAARQSNVSLCDRLYLTDSRDVCLSNFVSSSDARLCARMTASASQDSCYLKLAYATNSSALCDSVQNASTKSQCLSILAPCSQEANASATARCRALLRSDPAQCADDACRFELSIKLRRPDSCALIKDAAHALACKAVLTTNPDACKDANASYHSDYCYELAALQLNDSRWCDYGQQGSPYRDDCYQQFAIQRRDPSVCQKAFLETSRDWCYLNYSVALDEPSVCLKVINTLNQARCYVFTARTNGDASACNGLSGGDSKGCYNTVLTSGIPLRDAKSCVEVSNTQVWQPRCLIAYAVQSQNASVCDLIDSSSYRNDCRAKFA